MALREVAEVSGDEEVRGRGFCAFEEAVVSFIGGHGQAELRFHQHGSTHDGFKSELDGMDRQLQAWAMAHTMIFREDIEGSNEDETIQEQEFEDRRGRAVGRFESGDQQIGIDYRAYQADFASRRASARASAISASISSMLMASVPFCLEVRQHSSSAA